MVDELVVKEVQRYTLRALTQAQEGLTRSAIIRKVQSVCKKKYGSKCDHLQKMVCRALSFFKRNGFIVSDSNGRYMLQNELSANEDTAPQSKSKEIIYNIRKNCHLTTQEKSSRDLNPYKSVQCDSENSLSGDEIERMRKSMRTNTKTINKKRLATELENIHSFAASNEHICFLPAEGLRDFETLSVLHPDSYEFCGRMVFLPSKLQNPTFVSELDTALKVHTSTQVDNMQNPQQTNSYVGMNDLNSDELKPPKYINSHALLTDIAHKSSTRSLKRKRSYKAKQGKSKRLKRSTSEQ